MEDYEDSLDSTKVSKLNSGQLTNFLLNDLWIDFFKKFKKGEFKEANAHLDCIWIILGGDEKEEGDNVTKYTALDLEIGKFGTLGKPQKSGFKKLDNNDFINLTKQKEAINKKALFLRRLMNQQGKGTAYDTGDDDYMD